MAGGVLLGVSLFLPVVLARERNAQLNSCHGPHTTCTGWHSLSIVRYLLLLAAIAPAILAYIIVRGHALSWPRGELTAVTALAALTFIVFRGLIDRPGIAAGGDQSRLRLVGGLVGGLLILVGSIARSRESRRRRKPPESCDAAGPRVVRARIATSRSSSSA